MAANTFIAPSFEANEKVRAGSASKRVQQKPKSHIPNVELDTAAYNTHKHQYITQLHETYGDFFTASTNSAAHVDLTGSLPNKTVLFIRDPAAIADVLHSDERFAKTWDAAGRSSTTGDYVHNLVQPCVTNTIFNNVADRGIVGVHSGRLLLKSTFGSSERFVPEIEACLEKFLQRERASWCGGRVDVQKLSHDLIRRGLLVALVGGTLADEATDMAEQEFHETMEYFVARYADGEHSADVTAEDSERLGRIVAVARSIVCRWRDIGGPTLSGEADRYCLFHAMDKAKFDDDHMARMMVNTIIAAGEAPAIALSATIEELASRPDAQDKVVAEMTRTVGLRGRVGPRLSDLNMLDMTVLEGLRVFAPATLVMRTALVDTQLAGHAVPAGTVIAICITAVHHCEKIFQNASNFAPEEREDLNYTMLERKNPFLPFSAGPRGCPGKHIGTALLRVSLAKLLQNLRFEPPSRGFSNDGLRVAKFAGFMVNGVHLQVTGREQLSAL